MAILSQFGAEFYQMAADRNTSWSWELIAQRFRERRKCFGWTINEVAERTGLSRDTVMRVEKGQRCSETHLNRLRSVFALFSAQLVPHESKYRHFSACKRDEVRWMAATRQDHKGEPVNELGYLLVDEEAERARRAKLGWQRFFTGFIRAELPEGTISAALMEIYQPTWVDQHFGEEFIYCLEGQVLMTVDGEQMLLEPGDSMVFDALKPHHYGLPEGAVGVSKILVVVAMRPDEAKRVAESLPIRKNWGH